MNSYQEIVKKQLNADKNRNLLMIIGIIISVGLLISYSALEIFNKELDIEEAKKMHGNYDAYIQNLSTDDLDLIKKNYLIGDIGIAQHYKDGIFKINDSEVIYNIYSLNDIAINKVYKNTITLLEGKYPTNSKEILIEPIAKSELKKKVGDEIVFGEDKYIISGFANFGTSSSSEIKGITYLDDISKFESVNILFNTKDDEDVSKQIENIGSDLGYYVQTDMNQDSMNYDNSYLDNESNENIIEETYIRVNDELVSLKDGIYRNNAQYISALSYLLICTFTVILVYAYISSSISDKIKQISTLRCIGATPKQIRTLVFKESLMLSSFAIIPGIIMGYILTYVVTKLILEGMMGMNFYGLSISIYPMAILKTILISYLTVLIATIRPASYASRITPIEGVITKGTGVKNIKIRKNKFIRKRFGLVGDIAYRNMRASKNFTINTLVLSISMIILIVFTSYAQLMKGDIEFREGKIPSDGYVSIHQSDMEDELKEIREYLSANKVIKNIKSIGKVQDPILINKSSLNIDYNKDNYEYIQHGNDTSLYLHGTENRPIIYVYSDEVFEEIKKDLSKKDVTLEEFKNNGLILANMDGETPINKKIGDKIDISINIDNEYDVYNADEYIKQTKPISMNIISTVDADNIIEPDYNHQEKSQIKFIIHEDVYFKYINSLELDEMMSDDSFDILFDFISDEDRKASADDLRVYMDTMGHWYTDNQEEQEDYKKQLYGMSVLIYSAMIVLITIIFISISNSRSVNMLSRMKEFGMLLSVGINKRRLKSIIILESLMQSIMASIIALILSYIIVFALGNLMVSTYSIDRFEMSMIPFIMGIVLITIINSMTSIRPLNNIDELSLVDMMKSEK